MKRAKSLPGKPPKWSVCQNAHLSNFWVNMMFPFSVIRSTMRIYPFYETSRHLRYELFDYPEQNRMFAHFAVAVRWNFDHRRDQEWIRQNLAGLDCRQKSRISRNRKNSSAEYVDEGEASAMALCLEQTGNVLLIIDERKGRTIAQALGIKIIGTIGILIKAEETGIIVNLSEIIERLEQTDFRLSPKLKQQLLKN